MDMDFTFNNTNIKSFFEGNTADAPVAELIYLHAHPLIKPNFIIQLEQMILDAGQVLKARRMQGRPVEELISIALDIGQSLPDITSDNATKILVRMRDAYVLCNNLIGLK
jgi:hypothetical protein